MGISTQFILRSSLVDGPSLSPSKVDFRQVSSYNWLKTPQPTIAVPGHPAIWTPKPAGMTTRVTPDHGKYFISENAARSKKFPMEPPDFSFSNVAIVSDRATLRRLFAFVTATRAHGRDRKFVINVQRFGDLTLLSKYTKKPTCFVTKGTGGYGQEFEKAFTTWPKGLGDSSSHYQVVQYTFCGIEMIVSFETDATIHRGQEVQATNNLQSVTNNFSNLAVSQNGGKKKKTYRPANSSFHIRLVGTVVPYSTIAEMKTRNAGRTKNMSDTYPQLWFSNTFHLIAGAHKDGVFGDVPVIDTRASDPEKLPVGAKSGDGFGRWEKKNEKNLRMLGVLLKMVCEIAEGTERAFTVSYVDKEKLKVEEQPKEKMCLPEDVVEWVKESYGKREE